VFEKLISDKQNVEVNTTSAGAILVVLLHLIVDF